MQLKTAAGWNQTPDDWLRILRLEPDGCFGVEDEGTIVASATVVNYGADLSWIGMVLTLPPYRGRGYARILMERALDYSGSRPVRLDASDMGRPLYESLGFVAECPIERWRRPATALNARPVPIGCGTYDVDLDRAAFRADRSALLEDLAREQLLSAQSAYAFARPGSDAAFFGPCVASTAAEAESLLRAFTAKHAGEAAVLDLFPDNAAARGMAESLGYAPFRRLTRMVRKPHPTSLPDPRIYAIAGFEWG